MAILGNTLELGNEQAADGRFFYSPEASRHNPFYEYSQQFWLRHSNLIPDDSTVVVLQAGVTDANQLLDLDEPGAWRQAKSVITLQFDIQNRSRGVYEWGLTTAEPQGGREVVRLEVNSMQSLVKRTKYDAQGRRTSVEATEANAYEKLILKLSQCEIFDDKAQEKRKKQSEAEQRLAIFSVEALGKYSEKKYAEGIKEQQKRATAGFLKLGFSD